MEKIDSKDCLFGNFLVWLNYMKLTPEQLIDKLYGPPKKEGQKKLEDFKKKNIEKPEKPKSMDQIISAQDKEGKEIEFNLENIKNHWLEFYKQHNLEEIQKEIENIDIQLTNEQIDTIKEKTKEGFNHFILLPSIETQKQQLTNIKEQTEKPIKGLDDKQQYSDEGTWLSGTVKPNFPDHIQTNNRPENKPYLLFIKNTPEVDDETRNKLAEQLRQEFKQKQETGLTLQEYLIFQRNYTQTHKQEDKPHPDTKHVTWLLDSELDEESSGPSQVLEAHWGPGNRQGEIDSNPAPDQHSNEGARSSAIFEI